MFLLVQEYECKLDWFSKILRNTYTHYIMEHMYVINFCLDTYISIYANI